MATTTNRLGKYHIMQCFKSLYKVYLCSPLSNTLVFHVCVDWSIYVPAHLYLYIYLSIYLSLCYIIIWYLYRSIHIYVYVCVCVCLWSLGGRSAEEHHIYRGMFCTVKSMLHVLCCWCDMSLIHYSYVYFAVTDNKAVTPRRLTFPWRVQLTAAGTSAWDRSIIIRPRNLASTSGNATATATSVKILMEVGYLPSVLCNRSKMLAR